METIVVDETLPAKLKAISYPVQLVTADGQPLGVFRPYVPQEVYDAIANDDEVLRRVANPGKTFTTAEVLEHLKSLG